MNTVGIVFRMSGAGTSTPPLKAASSSEGPVTRNTVVLGGAPIGPRHIWWNLVHSDKERLTEQAERWRRGEFPSIPGDDDEFIPAPDAGP